MRSMRVYSRRAYRNTLAFGVALVAGAVVLLIADIWLLASTPGSLRTILGLVDAAMFFFGGAYVLAAFYGLAKAKK
jgi:hypothetical protein